jgi:hypothetical protein
MSEEEIEDPKRRAERLRREIERHNRLYYGLPVAMERKLEPRKSAALRECHWNGATRPSELILELQVAANEHIRVFVVKVRRNLFPNLGPLGRTCCSVKKSTGIKSSPVSTAPPLRC